MIILQEGIGKNQAKGFAMAIDPHYIPAFSIEDVLLDKDTGAPLSGGKVYFEKDNQRGILKPVYQITGTSPNYSFIQLPNPITLSAIGTFEDDLGNPVIPYFFPYNAAFEDELYYVRVTSANDVPQFDREAVPYMGSGGDSSITTAFQNEISNPQFSEVLFDTTTANHVFSFNAASNQIVEIAPDWSIIVSSVAAATVTVSQLKPTGTTNIITNPGTLLNINSSGVSFLRLRQRIIGSPNLWGSGFLSGTFVAKTYGGTSTTLTMYYSQSNGTVVDQIISSATLPASGNYAAYPGVVEIPLSTSPGTNPSAYVDIYFDLPLSTQIDITSVMLASTGQVNVDNIIYDQESNPRQIDHLFHYYKPWIFFKEIPSFLTGWDFPLNPAQFGENKTVTTTPSYVWDQTIMASAVGSVAVTRVGTSGALRATTTSGNEAFYMLQYLTGAQAVETALSALAVNVVAYSRVFPGVVVRAYLYNGNLASAIPATATSLGTLASSGVFTLTAANWTRIPQINGNAMSATIAQTEVLDYPFIGFNAFGSYYQNGTNNFAIVVTFQVPTAGTEVIVPSISCVPGNIATRPAPMTPTVVLSQCRYYWQKSFLPGVVPASNVGINSGESYGFQVTAGNATTNPGPIVRYPVQMRTSPIVTTYNPIAAGSEIANITGSASWTNTNILGSQSNGFYLTGNSSAGSSAGNICGVHWTANCRLGDVI